MKRRAPLKPSVRSLPLSVSTPSWRNKRGDLFVLVYEKSAQLWHIAEAEVFMIDINKVILVGRLGADPMERFTQTGTSISRFSIATTRRFLPSGGSQNTNSAEVTDSSRAPFDGQNVQEHLEKANENQAEGTAEISELSEASTSSPLSPWQEETQWHQIVVWGKRAQTCSQFLRKGDPVYIEGYLKTRSFQDKSGQQKWTTEVQAETISFLTSKHQRT